MLAAPEVKAAERVELRHDLRVDVPVTVGLAAGLAAYRLWGRDEVMPATCRWCDGARPDGVNAVDLVVRDALSRDDTRPARVASEVVTFGVAPIATGVLVSLAAGHEGHATNIPQDLLFVAEGTLAAAAAGEIAGAALARERPYVHRVEDDEAHAAASRESGALASFPSDHVLWIFAATSAAGTVASMRRYTLAPLVWIAGSMLGVTAAFLRVSADESYVTDTLAGAALGTLVGAGVPLLFHRPTGTPRWLDRATLSTQRVRSGAAASLTIAF